MTDFVDTTPRNSKHLLLLGAGHAHLQILRAALPRPGLRITLVSPLPNPIYSGMVPGFVAGLYTLQECSLGLQPLLQRSGVQWLARSARKIDAERNQVLLDDGSVLGYDWLSINTGPVQNREQIERSLPGAREHGLFVRPIEGFCALWPRVRELGAERALRLAVIGAGAAGIELALALRQCLPGSAVSLIAGPDPVGHNYPMVVQRLIHAALARRRIVLLPDSASAIRQSELVLLSGASLACDVPVIALGAQAPPWLAGGALALDPQGFVAVDACQRSTSHGNVFAVGDVASRSDLRLPRSGVQAVRAGPALWANLQAVVAGQAPRPYHPPLHTLNLLSCGDRRAIANWGNWSAEGRWVWYWKNWIDRRWVASFPNG